MVRSDRGGIEVVLEIGETLREARNRGGLELAEVEAATRIRVRYLAALEEERFELLPGGPYPRIFLREYAEFLGLDGDIYATEYDRRFASPEAERPSLAPRRAVGVRPLLGGPRLIFALALIGAIVVVGVVAVWQLGRPSGTGGVEPRSPP